MDKVDVTNTFYVTGGTLRPDAPSYVERQADRDLLEGLRRGEFCYVLTSRQMGKSSLMVRAAHKLRDEGVNAVVLDLTAIGQNLLAEQWYDGLMARMGEQLGLEDRLDEFWRKAARLSPVQRFFAALRDVVLACKCGSLVVFVDEIDTVRSLPFSTDEFFAAIRECYNRRPEEPAFNRITFCLLGVATPSDLIRDTRMTPFNIGRRIELNDFTEEEAGPLAEGFAHAPQARNRGGNKGEAASLLVSRVLYWTRGHPYLTQRLCQSVAEQKDAWRHLQRRTPFCLGLFCRVRRVVDRLCQELFLSSRAREQDDNLIFVRERLLRSEANVADLLSFYRRIHDSLQRVPNDETHRLTNLLHLAGIVRAENGVLRLRNRIYGRAFNRAWVATHMPDAERRRQREAYVKGLIRASGVAVVVLLVMAALVKRAHDTNKDLQEVTWKTLHNQAKANRLSSQAGRRFEALDAIRQAAALKATPDLRNDAIASLALPDLRPADRPWGNLPLGTTAATFSPDLTLLACGNGQGTVTVHSAAEKTPLLELAGAGEGVTAVRFSPGKTYLAAACSTSDQAGRFLVWELASKRPVLRLTNNLHEAAFDFSPDDRLLAVGNPRDPSGEVQVFDLPEGTLRTGFTLGNPCACLRFHPEDPLLAIASSNSLQILVRPWNSGSQEELILHTPSAAHHLAWHPHGRLLAAACSDQQVRLWSAPGESVPLAAVESGRQAGGLNRIAFNRRGNLLVSSGNDQAVRLWDLGQATPWVILPGAVDVRQLQFGPDDQTLAFEVIDNQIRFWEVNPALACKHLYDIEPDFLTQLAMDPQGDLLAAAHSHGVSLWDAEGGRPLGRMPVGETRAIAFQPSSGHFVASEFRGTYLFTRSESEDARGRLLEVNQDRRILDAGVSALSFTADGRVLAAALDGGRILLFRTRDWSLLDELAARTNLCDVSLSPSGHWLAAGLQDGEEVWIWDVNRRTRVERLPVPGRAQVRFSPDEHWLAIGTEKQCQLWTIGSWEPRLRVERTWSGNRPSPMAFSSDGRLWAFCLSAFVVHIRAVANSELEANLESPLKDPVVSLQFSPDGSRLACATLGKSTLLWDLLSVQSDLDKLRVGWPVPLVQSTTRRPPQPGQWVIRLSAPVFPPRVEQLRLNRQIAQLSDSIEENPGEADLRRQRGETYRKLGMFAEAVADYREWVRLDSDNPWALRDLAWLYLFGSSDVRNYSEAKVLAARAVELEKLNPDNHFRLGVACYRLSEFTLALIHLDSALQLSKTPVPIPFVFYHALCSKKRGLARQANESHQKALAAYEQLDDTTRRRFAAELSGLLGETAREFQN